VFSRRFAKSFPASSSGFEIETELSIHALDLKIATAEIPLPYGVRPADSSSKLRTVRDGCKILWTIGMMYRDGTVVERDEEKSREWLRKAGFDEF